MGFNAGNMFIQDTVIESIKEVDGITEMKINVMLKPQIGGLEEEK